jgi:DNA-binding transcriptional LysR family regulator
MSNGSCILLRVTPARLRTFLAVVDAGSARSAARQLHVTESAVSASLAALTKELGVALVERQGRGLTVTPAGVVFAGYARRILGLLDEAIESTRQDVDPEHGSLRLAAVTTVGEYLLPPLLAGFHRAHPDVRLSVEIGARDHVVRRIAEHAVDVVIGGRPPTGSGLRTWAWRANALVVVGAEPAGGLGTVTWLLREPGSGTREAALTWLRSRGLDPPTLTLGSHGAVVASAVQGLGVTLVSGDAVAHLLEDGRLVAISAPGTPLNRPWHVVCRPLPNPTTRLFLSHVCDPTLAGAVAFRAGRPHPTKRAAVHPANRPLG